MQLDNHQHLYHTFVKSYFDQEHILFEKVISLTAFFLVLRWPETNLNASGFLITNPILILTNL